MSGRVWAVLGALGAAALTLFVAVAGPVILDAVQGDEERLPANLEIVDARVEAGANGQPFVDILVRNSGEEEALVTRAVFTITSYSFVIASGQLSSSADYEVEFPTGQAVRSVTEVEANIAQTVDPAGARASDRFAIRIGVAAGGASGLHSYGFDLTLRYNVNSEATIGDLSARVNSR